MDDKNKADEVRAGINKYAPCNAGASFPGTAEKTNVTTQKLWKGVDLLQFWNAYFPNVFFGMFIRHWS
jgi:hypothetical protein